MRKSNARVARQLSPVRALCVLALLSLSGCYSRLPDDLRFLPDEVDVAEFSLDGARAKQLDFLGGTMSRDETYRHRISIPNREDGLKVTLNCERAFSPSKMCPAIELDCQLDDGQGEFSLEMRADGFVSVKLNSPWDTNPDDLVEVQLSRMGDAELNAEGVPGRDFEARLAEGVADIKTLLIDAPPTAENSEWFNRLSIRGDTIYVAVHSGHPHYNQAFSSLTVLGQLWAANSPSFRDCGFSGARR